MVIMIIVTIATIMMLLELLPFIEQQKDAIIAGVFSGLLVGVFSWLIHMITRTRPWIGISKKICHDYEDHKFRIKIRNNGLSNAKIISSSFVLSYNPNPNGQGSKNDIPIEGKADPLLFGLLNGLIHKRLNLRTFDTFVLDARLINEETIDKKTSETIKEKYNKQILTISDFFEEDKNAIISAVFEVQNFRTGACCIFSHTYHGYDILEETKFNSGRSFRTQGKDSSKSSDVN